MAQAPPDQGPIVRPHLHLHLESSQQASPLRDCRWLPGGQQEFFQRGDESARTTALLLRHVRAVHAEEAAQSVTHAELRILVQRYLAPELPLPY
jgi:hypothetical protein